MSKIINVAIDGPSGAGKSTIAKAAAERLGLMYVDTGALYRAIGVAVMQKSLDTKKKEDVISVLPGVDLDLTYVDGEQRVLLGGEDVSEVIRTPEASMAASDVSALPEVRAFLLDLQRDLAKRHSVIMDGRDIGTVILPDADYKFYLTASAEVRAQRRVLQLREKGIEVDEAETLAQIIQRDEQDMNREVAPLRQAEDAILVNSDHMTLEETIEYVVSRIR